MIMEDNKKYLAPACFVLEVQLSKILCGSDVMGNLDSPDYEDGGILPF